MGVAFVICTNVCVCVPVCPYLCVSVLVGWAVFVCACCVCIERQGVGGVYNSVDSIERGKPREKGNAASLGRLG